MMSRGRLTGGKELLLSDTVGFVQSLPTTLVAAFRATLEEVAEADLLVHVVDASYPAMQRQVEAVEQVLEEIGAGGRPVVVALNKLDLLPAGTTVQLNGVAATLPSLQASAFTAPGAHDLLPRIIQTLPSPVFAF